MKMENQDEPSRNPKSFRLSLRSSRKHSATIGSLVNHIMLECRRIKEEGLNESWISTFKIGWFKNELKDKERFKIL